MQLVISPQLTITDEVPQASHGNPVGLVSSEAGQFISGPNTPGKLNGNWTTPSSVVMDWLDVGGHTPTEITFASKFINPTFINPTP